MPQEHIGQNVIAKDFLDQLIRTDEIDIPANGSLTVKTRNSTYEFDLTRRLVRGGVVGPEWVAGEPLGATFGGSMIMVGKLIVGSLMEFRYQAPDLRWGAPNTSPVQYISYTTEGGTEGFSVGTA